MLGQGVRKISDLKADLVVPPSFAEEHITLRQHLGNGVYVLSGGDLGVVHELDGIYDEIMTGAELEGKVSPLFKFLRQVVLGIPAYESPQNTVVQMVCSQREVSGPPSKKVDGEGFAFSETDIGQILKREEEGLFGLGLAQRRFFLTTRYSPRVGSSSKLAGVLDFFKGVEGLEEVELGRLKEQVQRFEEMLKPIEGEVRAHQAFRRIEAQELVSYINNVLHGGTSPREFKVRDEDLQAAIFNPPLLRERDGIAGHDGRQIQAFVMPQHPESFGLGSLRMFMDAIPSSNWDLVWGFSHGLAAADQTLMMKAGWFSRGNSHQHKLADVQSFMEQIGNLKPHGIQSLRLLTYGLNEAEVSQIQSLAMDYLGTRMVRERQIPTHMIATSLPLCLSKDGNRITGRSHPVRLETSKGFWPLYSGPKAEDGVRWRVGRSGLPTRYDLFQGSGNRMMVTLGNSGGGKSAYVNDMILEFIERYQKRFPNAVVRIIDRNTSYRKTADLLGGKIVSFSESALKDSPYSPFALDDWDEEDIESLFVHLATAITMKNPGAEFSSLHTEILRDALKIAYNNQYLSLTHAGEDSDIEPHPIWTNVLAALPVAAANKEEAGVKGAGEAKDDIARWSVSLGETGQYGFLYSRHEKTGEESGDARFLVYDLYGIQDPVLQLLASQMAFMKITRDLSRYPRSVPKLIILEEYGMFVYGEGDVQKLNASFSNLMVKTARKLNAQLNAVSNGVSDFADNEAGRQMWNIATIKMFLPLGDAMVAELRDKLGAEFSEADLQIMQSLELDRKLKRSEAYIVSKNSDAPYKGAVLLPLSPEGDARVTSDGAQEEAYQRFLKEGMSPADAVERLGREHPFGKGL